MYVDWITVVVGNHSLCSIVALPHPVEHTHAHAHTTSYSHEQRAIRRWRRGARCSPSLLAVDAEQLDLERQGRTRRDAPCWEAVLAVRVVVRQDKRRGLGYWQEQRHGASEWGSGWEVGRTSQHRKHEVKRTSPTFMVATPSSQPRITWPRPTCGATKPRVSWRAQGQGTPAPREGGPCKAEVWRTLNENVVWPASLVLQNFLPVSVT